MLFIFLFLYIDLLFLDSLHNHFSNLDVSFLASSIIVFDNKKLNTWYITGYSDGDSSFWFSINPNDKLKVKYEVRLGFSIVASKNPANYKLMLLIDEYFESIGSIVADDKKKCMNIKYKVLKIV